MGHGVTIMVVPGGVSKWANPDALLSELKGVKHDVKAKMRGRVVNKCMRHNFNVADVSKRRNMKKAKAQFVSLRKCRS